MSSGIQVTQLCQISRVPGFLHNQDFLFIFDMVMFIVMMEWKIILPINLKQSHVFGEFCGKLSILLSYQLSQIYSANLILLRPSTV